MRRKVDFLRNISWRSFFQWNPCLLVCFLGGMLSVGSQSALAEALIQLLQTDQRAKISGFNPNQIYAVKTHYLISTDIILGEDELIDPTDVHLGDASAWDVETHRNHLYVKAKKLDAGGNLSITTDKYTYHFILSVTDAPIDSPDQTLFLKFTYPTHGEDEKKLALEMVSVPGDVCRDPHKYNVQYSFTGDKEQSPRQACDDGIFTYFKFERHMDLPAIFMVLPNREEEVVNYRIDNGYVVVERIAKAFTLRNGDVVTSVYNDKTIGDWSVVQKRLNPPGVVSLKPIASGSASDIGSATASDAVSDAASDTASDTASDRGHRLSH